MECVQAAAACEHLRGPSPAGIGGQRAAGLPPIKPSEVQGHYCTASLPLLLLSEPLKPSCPSAARVGVSQTPSAGRGLWGAPWALQSQIPVPGLGLFQRPPSFACRSRTGGGCGRVPGPKQSPSAGDDVMAVKLGEAGWARKETGLPQHCSLLVDASICSTTWLSLPRSGASAPPSPPSSLEPTIY